MSPLHFKFSSAAPTFWIDIGLILLSAGLLIATADYPDMASTFPRLVLGMIIAVTALDLIQIIVGRQKRVKPAPERHLPPQSYAKVFYLVVLMFAFYALLQLLGCILGTFSFLLIAAWTLGYRKLQSLIISSALITAGVYVIFQVIMKSFLPEGYLLRALGG